MHRHCRQPGGRQLDRRRVVGAPVGATKELVDDASLSTRSQSIATADSRAGASAAAAGGGGGGRSVAGDSADGPWMPAGAVLERLESGASVSTRSVVSGAANALAADDMSWTAAGATRDVLDHASVSSRSRASGGGRSRAPGGGATEGGGPSIDGISLGDASAAAAGMEGVHVRDGGGGDDVADDDDDHHSVDASWHAAGATGNLLDDDMSLASASTRDTFQSAISALTDPTALFQHHPPSSRRPSAGGDAPADPSSAVVWELYRIQGLLRSVLDERGDAEGGGE